MARASIRSKIARASTARSRRYGSSGTAIVASNAVMDQLTRE